MIRGLITTFKYLEELEKTGDGRRFLFEEIETGKGYVVIVSRSAEQEFNRPPQLLAAQAIADFLRGNHKLKPQDRDALLVTSYDHLNSDIESYEKFRAG